MAAAQMTALAWIFIAIVVVPLCVAIGFGAGYRIGYARACEDAAGFNRRE